METIGEHFVKPGPSSTSLPSASFARFRRQRTHVDRWKVGGVSLYPMDLRALRTNRLQTPHPLPMWWNLYGEFAITTGQGSRTGQSVDDVLVGDMPQLAALVLSEIVRASSVQEPTIPVFPLRAHPWASRR